MFKQVLKQIADRLGYVVQKKGGHPIDVAREKEYLELFAKCQDYTMVSSDRAFGLYKAVEYLVRTRVAGDIVECGVWRGGQSMLAAYTLMRKGDTARTLWLYDTYTGMSEPTEHDVYAYAEEAAPLKWERHNKDGYNDWCYAPFEDVKKNMESTGYPMAQIKFIQGKVEDTIPAAMPEKIALLRLDTDWYESTRHELEYLYPRLATGGILLIDDYGSWEGARKAVDEYIESTGARIFLARLGSGRIGVKLD